MKEFLTETWARWSKWFTGWLHGGPHFVVGDPSNPYLRRWYIIPRNDWLCIYLHQFLRDDDDRALHDHPWHSLSFLVWGRYVEQTPTGKVDPATGEKLYLRRLYRMGSIKYRCAEYAHRIELVDGRPTWTLFFTGTRVREWGFLCPAGWRHWKEFTKADSPGEVGKGCDG